MTVSPTAQMMWPCNNGTNSLFAFNSTDKSLCVKGGGSH